MNPTTGVGSAGGVDVLVVEDEERLRSFVLRALPGMGLSGLGVASADEARRLLREREARVLLLDIRLGGASGLDLLEGLRASGDERPAVFITAYADVPSAQRALRCDAADFLTKPFTLDQLEHALSRACRRARRTHGAQLAGLDDAPPEPPASLDAAKRRALLAALERTGGNKLRAARQLGISRRTLYNWLERYAE